MNVIHHRICPLCGDSRIKPFVSAIDCYATGETFQVMRCPSCGLAMTQDVPVEAEIGRYYESPDYISHTDTRKGLMNSVYHIVRRHMLKRKSRLVRDVTGLSSGRILDIGTGTGYFLKRMYDDGWDVEGTEKSQEARAFCLSRFSIPVQDDRHNFSFDDSSFDAITMWHVMEHVEDLDSLWENLSRMLKDTGTLIVAVPNLASADFSHYRSFWAALDVPRHLWHFTPSSMSELARRHGFRMAERMPMPFDGFYISMLSEKYKGSSLYFLFGLCWGLACLLRSLVRKDRSSSIIYILRKKQEK